MNRLIALDKTLNRIARTILYASENLPEYKNVALDEIKVLYSDIEKPLFESFNKGEIAKWMADLKLGGYIKGGKLEGEDFVAITEKGLTAAISKAFEAENTKRGKDNWQFLVQIISGIITSATAIIAIFISVGLITCNKLKKDTEPTQVINIQYRQHESTLNSSRPNPQQDSAKR